MGSTGIDRRTGRVLTDFDHVLQSVEVIFTTRIGSRVMLRPFGSGLVELLGRRIIPRTLGLYRHLVALAITTWEPRLQVVRVVAAGNTVNAVSLGELRWLLQCYYRPNAHRGDLTVEGGLRWVGIGLDGTGSVRIQPAAAPARAS